MARSVNSDPLLVHNFALIDVPVGFSSLRTAFPIQAVRGEVETGSFIGAKSVEIPEMTLEMKEIRELTQPFVHSVPTGYSTTGDVTIEMALFNNSTDMYFWFMQAVRGLHAPRRSLKVVQTRNDKRVIQRVLLLEGCVPRTWTPASPLDAQGTEVVVERLVLNVHLIEIRPLPVPQV